MNYFDFYGIDVGLEPDMLILKKRYLENHRKFHPDHNTQESDNVQEEMLERASQNNLAYKTLKDRDLRLKHILSLSGLVLENDHSLSQEFLMEMMEMNEKVMMAEEKEEKENIRSEILDLDAKSYEVLLGGLPGSIDVTSMEGVERVKGYYFRRKYLLRIIENLDNLRPL